MKKAFTLIELMLAIAIFTILIAYMYQAVATTKKSTTIYENLYKQDKKNLILKEILYNDIFNQTDPYSNTSIKTSGKFSTYYLRTNNSLHAIPSPYVAYSIKSNTLYRYESIKSFTLPMNEENKNYIKVDKLSSDITTFLIYSYKNDKLIEWIKDKKRTIFEISLPYSRTVVVVGG